MNKPEPVIENEMDANIVNFDIYIYIYIYIYWLVGWVLRHISLCRLFIARPIFIQIINSISNNSVFRSETVSFQAIQFSKSTLFNCKYIV